MRRLLSYLWLCLAGLTLATLVPATAQGASCGHYVQIGSPQNTKATHAEMPASQPGEKPTSQPAPSPCSGPGCSQHREPLLPTPATPTSVEDERWGQPFLGSFLAEDPTDRLPLPWTDARPVRAACSIYHPPR